VRKVGETCTQVFITNDKPNINGLVLAGSAEFKMQLAGSDWFDPRLAAIHILTLDVSYGGENGFNQAVELASDTLKDVKFVKEKKLIGQFFEEIAQDSGKFSFGVKDTMKALDMGAIETLIMYEELPIWRLVIKQPSTGIENTYFLTAQEEKNPELYKDKETGGDNEVTERDGLSEWLVEHYKDFGAKLEFVTDKSQEGHQFCKGFGGIGGLLRYRVEFDQLGNDSDLEFSDEDDFM